MHFIINESNLHYYEPEDEGFLFVNTVAGNNEIYNNQNIKATEQ